MAEEFRTPQSANEALLQNILGAENEIREPQSVTEYYLKKILEKGTGGGDIYVHNLTIIDLSVRPNRKYITTIINDIAEPFNYTSFVDWAIEKEMASAEKVIPISGFSYWAGSENNVLCLPVGLFVYGNSINISVISTEPFGSQVAFSIGKTSTEFRDATYKI